MRNFAAQLSTKKDNNMKKILYSLTALCLMMTAVSCGNGNDKEQLNALQADYDQLSADYEELNSYLGVIAGGLDSIAAQEGTLFATNSTPGESPALSREQIKKNLDAYKNTLAAQRERIAGLEQQLKTAKGNAAKLRSVVELLNEQLAAKDAQIDELRRQASNQNVSMAQLVASLQSLEAKNAAQAQTISDQQNQLTAQDNKLNEAFVKMGPKKELKELGLMSGGNLLKKSKVDYDNMDKKLFRRIDIRKTKNIEIPYKKAKIITPVPSGSYTMEQHDDYTYLIITNPDRFWSVSNYLIIQTDD